MRFPVQEEVGRSTFSGVLAVPAYIRSGERLKFQKHVCVQFNRSYCLWHNSPALGVTGCSKKHDQSFSFIIIAHMRQEVVINIGLVLMEEESIPIRAFVTPFGQFQRNYVPFGLRNAPFPG